MLRILIRSGGADSEAIRKNRRQPCTGAARHFAVCTRHSSHVTWSNSFTRGIAGADEHTAMLEEAAVAREQALF